MCGHDLGMSHQTVPEVVQQLYLVLASSLTIGVDCSACIAS
jgi:hypothetical protein